MGSGSFGGIFYGQYSQGGTAPAVQEAFAHYIVDVPAETRVIDVALETRVIDVVLEARVIRVPETE